jgi:DNA-directed RNA polymerase specialized sigma subunit, sigma24 homolog
LDALGAAYEILGADLWRSVYAYTRGNRHITDDAVAEAFAAAAAAFGDIRDLRSWLYRVAFRAATKLLRERSRDASISVETVGNDGSLLSAEMLDVLSTLTAKQRGCVVLVDVFGFDSRGAGDALGMSDVAVRVSLHTARRKLRSHLERAEDES